MIPNNFSEYYGDDVRWFIGIVKNVNDPLQLGRVQVRIYGIHSQLSSDIPDADLPWAQTVLPVTEGGTSGKGANTGIQTQAQVFGIFLDGKNSQLPLVLGSIPKIATISKEQKQSITPPSTSGGGDKKANPSGGGSITKIEGGSNIEKAYKFFISKEGGDFKPHQAAGIIGNLMQESGAKDIQPTVVNSIGATGIAQWLGPRKKELKTFAADNNIKWDTIECQCQFIKYELEKYTYLGGRQLRASKTADEAAEHFCLKFERPGEHERALDKRQKYAREVLEKFENPK